jgi:hypothetical protein
MTTIQTQTGFGSIRNTTTRNQTGVAFILVDVILQLRKINFYAQQGATFNVDVPVYNADGSIFDLTGYSVIGWMSRSYQSLKPSIELQLAIKGDPTQGIINWTITRDNSLTLYPDIYVYNIDVLLGDNQYRVLKGNINVEPGVNLVQVVRCRQISGFAVISGGVVSDG